jgi:hypothetical protein
VIKSTAALAALYTLALAPAPGRASLPTTEPMLTTLPSTVTFRLCEEWYKLKWCRGTQDREPTRSRSEKRVATMLRRLLQFFTRRPYRTAQPWETPAEIRTKLRCASVGIDPTTVKELKDGKGDRISGPPALEGQPPSKR